MYTTIMNKSCDGNIRLILHTNIACKLQIWKSYNTGLAKITVRNIEYLTVLTLHSSTYIHHCTGNIIIKLILQDQHSL